MADIEERSQDSSSRDTGHIKPGIIYLSRIPPYMRPLKIRHVFSKYGKVGRIYLQPEDQLVRKRRKKYGGSKKLNYTEGWVEFCDKRVAKTVALMLNNRPVGGKKRSYYHDDIWNIKYLSKFMWTHITEKIAYDNAVRNQKLRTELSQTRKQANTYLESVEKQKIKQAIIERKKKSGRLKEGPQRTVTQRKIEQVRSKKQQISDSLLKKIL